MLNTEMHDISVNNIRVSTTVHSLKVKIDDIVDILILSSRSKHMTTKIMEMIPLGDQPFSIAEDDGFCGLINSLEVRVASLMSFSLSASCDAAAAYIYEILRNNISNKSFTTDLWSSEIS